MCLANSQFPHLTVTDMLVAVLNTCTKEELDELEPDEDLALMSPITAQAESVERRKVIKNKIMAVGRMARVFALLRCVVRLQDSSVRLSIFWNAERSQKRFLS